MARGDKTTVVMGIEVTFRGTSEAEEVEAAFVKTERKIHAEEIKTKLFSKRHSDQIYEFPMDAICA